MTILVLGMHRSGTSALTALIESMGATIGAPGELLPASPDNPRGFFERKDILAANRAIMQHHHSNWYQVEQFDTPAPPLPAAIHAQMQQVIQALKPRAPYALKDPRFCFTLPYWLPYLENPVIVLAIRHPAAIADSLRRRNDMPLEQGLALWEHYMTHALKNIEGLKVIRCQYEYLIAQPEATARELHTALAADFPSLTAPNVTILDASLAHGTPSHISLNPAQQALYKQLQKS